MKITSREFQRDFARIRDAAATGEPVYITSAGQEFVFKKTDSRSWQGALKGRVNIVGDLHDTGLKWEAAE